MATTIAILKDGTPVRIHLFDTPIFDVDGFLVRFTTLETNPQVYRYHQHEEFKREDRKKPDLSGYYNEDLFVKYIQKVEPIPTLDILTKYNFNKVLATEGEEITVSTIDFDKPYNYFYNEKKYTFNLQRTLDNKGVRNYLKPIIENFETVDIKINTDGVNGVTILNNQSGTPSGYFYKKNLGDFINTWTISDIQKSNLKKVMSLIVFKIREINKYIIPIIAANTHFFDKETDVANGIIDYNDTTTGNRLTDLEKLLFDLKRGWGYYYNPLNPEDFPLREDFDAQFTQLSSYQDYVAYHSSLENFYNKCYITKNLEHYPSDKKLQYLLEILSSSALSLLPYEFRINTIKKYLKINLSQEDQRLMVRLVLSISPSHANDFLDFLLEKEDGVKTNFQVIYDSLTDARLERYSFVNWFVNEQPNRKYFAFAIFELWKVSKYDLNYIRPGITVPDTFPNFRGVDPQNYFYINKSEYNEKNWLTFIPSSTESITTTAQYFESSLVGKKININKISKTDINIEHGGYHDTDVNVFGSFHLYQQISFSGFKANLDLAIPTMATVPAFLFHFIQEYDELADFDAGVALSINLTVDALLVYFTGGMSVLRDLQYLKYTTQIGRALQGGVSGVGGVEVWRGLEFGSEIFTVTTLGLININHYLITSENDEEKRKILEKCQTVFLILMMVGAASSLTARSKAVQEANQALRLIDLLPPNTLHNIPQEMIDVLTTLSGQKAVTLTLFGNKLNNLELAGAANTIAPKYNMLFTDAQKLAFWKDFQHVDDPAFWRLLNSGKNADGVLNGSFIDNWLNLTERALPEATITDYICFQRRTDYLIKYVDKVATSPIISKFNLETRFVFVDIFGDVNSFAKFAEDPQLVTYWKRCYDDLVIRSTFSSISNSKQIKLLERYGNSEELFLRIKNNPDIILSFDKYSDHPELLLNIQIYAQTIKDEIIFYERFGSNNVELFNIFKNDPSEIVYEIGYYTERIVEKFKNFRYEKLIAQDEICFNVLNKTGIESSWPNKSNLYRGELSFDLNTSLLKENGYDIKVLGQKWTDDAFEIWEDSITSVKTVWTENTNYPGGESLGFKEFNNVYQDTFDMHEAVKATTFYRTMSKRNFVNIHKVYIGNQGEITVILKK